MTNPKVQTITIKLPFWLRWAKRFVKLENRIIEQKGKVLGQHLEMIIIDEDFTTNEEIRIYADKLLHLKSPKRKEDIHKVA